MSTFHDMHAGPDGVVSLSVTVRGHQILDTPMLNKGSAFSDEERRELGLIGLLPPHVATMDEQVARTYENYCQKTSDLERYVFLTSLQDRNEVLFYRLLQLHTAEMMPIIYTPIVGTASQHYSHIYRRPRGLYIAYPAADAIEEMLRNVPYSDVRVIVVTDGERILGLGDLGIGGMGIPIGKLALYTLCAGIHPATTLPIILDVGTNNRELLDDPLYLGWRHERMRGSAYAAFIEAFVAAVIRVFPNVILQWEDFAKQNAATLLDRYRDRLCTFNDDIQGTGAVTVAGLLAATGVAGVPLPEQRIVMLGAGSSVHGICDQLVAAMCDEGATPAEARRMIWLVDSRGLVHAGRTDLGDEPFKVAYAQPASCTDSWDRTESGPVTLAEIVHNVRPGILIGAAAQPGAFSAALVRDMASHVDRPIIFPISNPTSKSEATPADLLAWTDGRALIATGSPYAPVPFGDKLVTIGQCNNVFIFPGVGLGILASGARRVTDSMFVAAARALSELSPARQDPTASLYPALSNVRLASRQVALAVAREAQRVGVAAPSAPEELADRVDALMWEPRYATLRRG
ncbi:MAG: NAD-dependent malic enzyme [Chloroflexales bacterium]